MRMKLGYGCVAWGLVSLYVPLVIADELSKEVQEAFSEANANTQSEDAPSAEGDPAIAILSRVTSSEGIPFPKSDEVVWEPTPTPEPLEQNDSASTPEPYKKPGRCESNETRRELVYSDRAETRTFYDVLYISEDLVPLEPEEVFGAGVKLRPYGPKSGDGVYIQMELHSVPCLPYRIRVTDSHRYQDLGLNALKNYSKNPAGKGELDPLIQQKLFGSKGRPRR